MHDLATADLRERESDAQVVRQPGEELVRPSLPEHDERSDARHHLRVLRLAEGAATVVGDDVEGAVLTLVDDEEVVQPEHLPGARRFRAG